MERKGENMNLAGWHTLIPHPIKGPDDAVALVTTLGFCTWGPMSRMAFPNLAEAMGETATSVLARTWFWKDDLHLARQLYYGKIIAGQPSFIAPGYLEDFIAALAGWGLERERDPIKLYLDGRLSREARAIYAGVHHSSRYCASTDPGTAWDIWYPVQHSTGVEAVPLEMKMI
jgi:hypothetical protein